MYNYCHDLYYYFKNRFKKWLNRIKIRVKNEIIDISREYCSECGSPLK